MTSGISAAWKSDGPRFAALAIRAVGVLWVVSGLMGIGLFRLFLSDAWQNLLGEQTFDLAMTMAGCSIAAGLAFFWPPSPPVRVVQMAALVVLLLGHAW